MNKSAILLAAVLLTLPGTVFADELPAGPGAAAVSMSQLEKQSDRLLLNGSPFTGTVIETWPDGTRKARFQVVEGKADGAWAEWYPDGAIRFYSEWRAGKGQGPFVYFHPNGEISERVTARDDIWDGVAEGWHPNGQKAFERVYQAGTALSERRFPASGEE
ncbi:toxin-antitoxin system YwqK family antitoxin [Erythrobacter sp. W302b]|uniref:toxin-antitoxin system YwqK family antitoxin n=1 Tax=Erythrobacter sp. W302b TaxID=3389874 RepID=UPI00396B3D57